MPHSSSNRRMHLFPLGGLGYVDVHAVTAVRYSEGIACPQVKTSDGQWMNAPRYSVAEVRRSGVTPVPPPAALVADLVRDIARWPGTSLVPALAPAVER